MIVYRVILFSVSVIPFLPNCLFSCYNHSFCLRPELTFFCSTFPLKVSCLLSLDSSLFLSVNQLALLHLSIAQDQDQQLSCSLFSLQSRHFLGDSQKCWEAARNSISLLQHSLCGTEMSLGRHLCKRPAQEEFCKRLQQVLGFFPHEKSHKISFWKRRKCYCSRYDS